MGAFAFSILDVFVSDAGRFSGNQLAVVPEASSLGAEAMQETAREFHFSETVFITGKSGGAFSARIFTPEEELPFAGHPVIGLAHYIRERVLKADVPVGLDLGVGRVMVQEDESESGLLWMAHREPSFGNEFSASSAAAAISLSDADLDPLQAPMAVSTGLPFLIIPIATKAALDRAFADREAIRSLFAATDPIGLYLFTRLGPDRFAARMFAPHLGIEEDPATGSAAGCLAAFLCRAAYQGEDGIDAVLEQGAMVKRPSILRLRARKTSGSYKISVGGKARIVAGGEIFID